MAVVPAVATTAAAEAATAATAAATTAKVVTEVSATAATCRSGIITTRRSCIAATAGVAHVATPVMVMQQLAEVAMMPAAGSAVAAPQVAATAGIGAAARASAAGWLDAAARSRHVATTARTVTVASASGGVEKAHERHRRSRIIGGDQGGVAEQSGTRFGDSDRTNGERQQRNKQTEFLHKQTPFSLPLRQVGDRETTE
jgi:hypothetical protein